jgi:integrase/recombinase XerD
MTRSLFVTERAPRVGFTNGQILNTVLQDAFTKTGLKPPMPWIGAHVLRHSLAVSLVKQGSSIEEIAHMLRHRSRATTLLYARLDMDGLRSLALPWPAKRNAK